MRTDFLYASIADTQGTIRSIDVRAGFLFVVLFLPLSVLDKISTIYGFPAKLTGVMTGWIIIDILLWVLAIGALFRCVVAIDSPAAHVSGPTPKGAFYGGDLFNLTKYHTFWNCTVLSSRDIAQEKMLLPQNAAEIETELLFEKMKLTYIRSVKLLRFAAAAWLTLLWLIASASLAVYTRALI
ncbi:MAG: hypothetical protein J0I47_08280 [Sphingomonas sp.]|uniref:hypothetical protein n=1 Tax=Sphingomonas sp. TaxID=28214 RepID=UPI001AC4D9C1|nr:hypothetical protein [Sphingomonas sp.]MBN8808220.1 hypothetical protein [Sphingomonas sp.]